MIDQQRRVRGELTCINCGNEKSAGLVICWPCHALQKHHNDGCYSKRLEKKLAEREAALKDAGVPEWHQ